MFNTRDLPNLDYEKCAGLLNGRKAKKLCNATWLKDSNNGYYSVELFNTEIIRVYPDKIACTLAGWPTTTTRQRLNALVPSSNFYPHKHKQYCIFAYPIGDSEIAIFDSPYDGNGKVSVVDNWPI